MKINVHREGFYCGPFGKCKFNHLLKKDELEPRGFEKVIVHSETL